MTKKTKEKLLKIFGSQIGISKFLCIHQSNINRWFSGINICPLKHAIKISNFSNGFITLKELGWDL